MHLRSTDVQIDANQFSYLPTAPPLIWGAEAFTCQMKGLASTD